MQPKDHQSVDFPCPFLDKISGERYSGVPQKLVASFPVIDSFDNPKSVILAYPSEPINTFSGFKLKV